MEEYNLKEAIDILEKEKNIDREILLSTIEEALENASKKYFAKKNPHVPVDLKVVLDKDTCEWGIFVGKEVIDDDMEIMTDLTEVHLSDAKKIDETCEVGDVVYIEEKNIKFGHIIVQNARGVIIQTLREQEKNSLYNEFKQKEHTVVNGTVGRRLKNATNIELSNRAQSILLDSDCIRGEKLKFGSTVKVYIQDVQESSKGPKIKVSRADPNLVRILFENEVEEIKDGVVEIKSIAREAGSRSKMAVHSNDENIDAVGSCLGVNSVRVNAVVDMLNGEKIDIVSWDSDISTYIENALSPAKSVAIVADEDTKEALVIVPDNQLSLAIGKEGQNARLAVRLTGYKIDIKSETQAVEAGIYDELGLEYDKAKYQNVKKEEVADDNKD
ncbi:MAG: transcription termination factor NusA [Lachnospiraceae bacterium]|nr:transcription termination factor NusA [Lachnospiraceae bacterium]